MVQSRKATSFFDLPPEIRVLVYQHYFSYESYEELQLHRYFKITKIRPATLKFKTPLLQSNQVVLTEALPVFYQHYLFRIEVPRLKSLVKVPHERPPQLRRSEYIRHVAPALPLMTRMDLLEPCPLFIWSWDRKMAPFLRCLCNYCSKLRFLRLSFEEDPGAVPWRTFARESCKYESFALLAQLAQRLDWMQISFMDAQDDETVEFCKSIAPEACWTKDTSTSVWSCHHGIKVIDEI